MDPKLHFTYGEKEGKHWLQANVLVILFFSTFLSRLSRSRPQEWLVQDSFPDLDSGSCTNRAPLLWLRPPWPFGPYGSPVMSAQLHHCRSCPLCSHTFSSALWPFPKTEFPSSQALLGCLLHAAFEPLPLFGIFPSSKFSFVPSCERLK